MSKTLSAIIAVPILGALLILQTVILSQFPLLHGIADLVLLAVSAWALQKRVQTAWHWAVIGGLMVSFVSAIPYFIPLITYLLTTGLALLLRQRVWQVPILAMLITTLTGTLFYHALSIVLLRISGVLISIIQILNIITLPSLILNLLLAVPMYAVFSELAKIIYRQELEA